MNIKEAKFEIKNSLLAYFTKDPFGDYQIPIHKQRPIFLLGPPGIGKTAIMEQIASEMGIGLLSYSMTHHTRQSALGLPFISEREFGGKKYQISEYTMSEIIASVYEIMEETKLKEGILFLDEINCVSETLAPAMLQFLQYKTFGRHKIPDGWIVVTAGNPPEYNSSVREFDIATLDRLKKIEVEPNYKVWREYAIDKEIHPSILSYLDLKSFNFYNISTTVDGSFFVTARGWDDLANLIKIYEEKEIPVKQTLIEQYLQDKKISKDFSIYYDLFKKYNSDYQIDKILDGSASDDIFERARSAKFDERFALIVLLLDSIFVTINQINRKEKVLERIVKHLRSAKDILLRGDNDGKPLFKIACNDLAKKEEQVLKETLALLQNFEEINAINKNLKGEKTFALLKASYDEILAGYRKSVSNMLEKLNNVFIFIEKTMDDGQELLILTTELTSHKEAAYFISRHGCEKYFEHNKELLIYERHKALISELEELDSL